MSRHRGVRNRQYSYDYDDDYYDDDYYSDEYDEGMEHDQGKQGSSLKTTNASTTNGKEEVPRQQQKMTIQESLLASTSGTSGLKARTAPPPGFLGGINSIGEEDKGTISAAAVKGFKTGLVSSKSAAVPLEQKPVAPPPGWTRPSTTKSDVMKGQEVAAKNVSEKNAIGSTIVGKSRATAPPPSDWSRPATLVPTAPRTTDALEKIIDDVAGVVVSINQTQQKGNAAKLTSAKKINERKNTLTKQKNEATITASSGIRSEGSKVSPVQLSSPSSMSSSFTAEAARGRSKSVPVSPSSTQSSSLGGTTASTTSFPHPRPPTAEELGGGRSRLSMVVLGHVDAGKSTLMGQLLVQMGKVERRIVNKYQRKATELGKASFALAWVMDEDESERERGVTMDIATKTISTTNHDITILDAPGHRDFIPAMIGGAAAADVGLLVVAATTGEFESGFDLATGRGQTREHILLSRGLGVSQLIVAVNKLDAADPPWNEGRFKEIEAQIIPFLISCGFNSKRIRFVPLSGLTGENVMSRGEDAALSRWYEGLTLYDAINGFFPAQRSIEKPFRFIVSDAYAEGRAITARGRVVQGFLRTSEIAVALPIGDVGTVSRIEHGDLVASSEKIANAVARAGDNVEISLSGIDIARINPGFVVCHAAEYLRVPLRSKFQARILVMEMTPTPIIRGSQVALHMHSLDVPAIITNLLHVTKKGIPSSTSAVPSAKAAKSRAPRVVMGGASAIVEISVGEKMCLEEFSECRALGRFVLRRSGETLAVGVIVKLIS